MNLIAEGWHGGGPCGPLPFLLFLLLGAGIAFAVWWWKRRGPSGSGQNQADEQASAEGLLADRFARGDITDEEYWERLSVLRESRAGKRPK